MILISRCDRQEHLFGRLGHLFRKGELAELLQCVNVAGGPDQVGVEIGAWFKTGVVRVTQYGRRA
jgi:hypothetical protein